MFRDRNLEKQISEKNAQIGYRRQKLYSPVRLRYCSEDYTLSLTKNCFY